jgi:hypothetical protein
MCSSSPRFFLFCEEYMRGPKTLHPHKTMMEAGMDTDGSSSVESDEQNLRVTHIVTANVMLDTGLKLLYMERWIERVKGDQTNIDLFLNKYGIKPITACTVYKDLQMTDVEEARIVGSRKNLQFFMVALYFLQKYPNREDLERITFDYSPGYISNKI